MVFGISPLENWGQNVKITTGLALCQNNDDWKPPMKHNMYVSFDRSTTYSATRTLKLPKLYGGLCGVFFFHFDKGSLISERFSLSLESPKKGTKSEHYPSKEKILSIVI